MEYNGVWLLDDGKHEAHYLSEDNNPAVISKEAYQAVEIEKSHRSNVAKKDDGQQRKNKKELRISFFQLIIVSAR